MEVKLTGKTRYRVHKPFLGKPLLVVQVEESRRGWVWDVEPSGYVDSQWVEETYWRDMRVTDIQSKEANGSGTTV